MWILISTYTCTLYAYCKISKKLILDLRKISVLHQLGPKSLSLAEFPLS
jgi:hypothetical protein